MTIQKELAPLFETFDIKTDLSGEAVHEVEALAVETAMIHEAVHLWLSNWRLSFPFPSRPSFPEDYKEAERSRLRRFVGLYISINSIDPNGVDGNTLDNAVKEILDDNDFPVPSGRIPSVVTSVFKQLCAEKRKRRPKRQRDQDDGEEEPAQKAQAIMAEDDDSEEGNTIRRRRKEHQHKSPCSAN